ncbi:MAG: glycerol-3-phosphate acyltransferase [Phycisphaerae bacterium]|nr:glycerol-3-phosphate acyltransferase [Phycisphaerae bacterium]
MNARDFFVILASYGLGCLVTGYYLVRWRTRQDIRNLGSGSVGARNVNRILGRCGFWITLTGDILKGAIAIAVGRWLGTSPTVAMLSLLAVVTGHVFPIQLRFHGGKGIAVSLGALGVLDFRIAAGWMFAFAVLFLCSRHYMLSGIISILLIPVIAAVLGWPAITLIGLIFWVGLILFAHRKNIADLFKGKIPPDAAPGPQRRTE